MFFCNSKRYLLQKTWAENKIETTDVDLGEKSMGCICLTHHPKLEEKSWV